MQDVYNKIKETRGIRQEQFYRQVFLEGYPLEGRCTRGQAIISCYILRGDLLEGGFTLS